MENAVAGAAIIGLVNLVQHQFPEVKGLYGILLAVALGVVAGFLGLYGLTIESGTLKVIARIRSAIDVCVESSMLSLIPAFIGFKST